MTVVVEDYGIMNKAHELRILGRCNHRKGGSLSDVLVARVSVESPKAVVSVNTEVRQIVR